MSERVINDPSALGWDYDPSTGRWTWGGGSNSGGGGGNFPEAPVDGKQYGRQDAGWTQIISGGGSGGNDPRISDKDISDWSTSFSWGNHAAAGYLEVESDPTVPDHVKAITPTDIANWNAGTGNGGGGGVDPRISDTQISNWDDAYGWGNHATKGYLTATNLNGYATQTWVSQNYQVKGSYATSNHNHSGVYQPAGNYALVGASYTKAESDAKYELKGAGGGGATPDLQAVTDAGSSTTNQITAAAYLTPTATWTLGMSSNARIFCSNGTIAFKNTSNTNSLQITNGGTVTATANVVAYSDERLKSNIETLDGSKVYQMRGVSFTKDGEAGSGVIAQEIQKIAPELVHDDGEYLGVAYGNLVGYLIEAVKDLKAEIEELKSDS